MKKRFAFALLCAAVVIAVLAVEGRRLRTARAEDRVRAEELRNRVNGLDVETRALEERCVQLREALAAMSNRAARAEASLAEERETHDPLRRQIESLLAESRTREAALRDKERELEEAASRTAAVDERTQKLSGRIAEAEARLAEAASRAAELSDALDKATRNADGLAAQLVGARAAEKLARDALAEERRKSGELRAANDALRAELSRKGGGPAPRTPPGGEPP